MSNLVIFCKSVSQNMHMFVKNVLDKLIKRVYNTKHRGKDVSKVKNFGRTCLFFCCRH